MTLERAIAAYLTGRISGLHAFKDDLAFVAAGNPYPYFLIELISTRRKAVGTGVWDQIVLQDGVRFATKAVSVHQALRFTVRAVNIRDKNGNAVAAEICDQIEARLNEICRSGAADLNDPDSVEPLHLERVVFQGRYDLPPIEKGTPFVYQQAVTYLFVEQRLLRQEVPATLDKIGISLMEI
jgi:hypothetical protein